MYEADRETRQALESELDEYHEEQCLAVLLSWSVQLPFRVQPTPDQQNPFRLVPMINNNSSGSSSSSGNGAKQAQLRPSLKTPDYLQTFASALGKASEDDPQRLSFAGGADQYRRVFEALLWANTTAEITSRLELAVRQLMKRHTTGTSQQQRIDGKSDALVLVSQLLVAK
jgi:hypothetical protein